MKTVWVNRHNADGTFKPMNEWELWQCNENQTHTYPCHGGGRSFDGGGLPDRNCFITEFGTVRDSGIYFLEYIGNQRGDGWLYVADGDLPPEVEDEYILVQTRMGKYATTLHELSDWIVFSRIHGKPICWQPIQQPKFIGECDV